MRPRRFTYCKSVADRKEENPIGFSSFLAFGRRVVCCSRLVGARIARPIGAFRLKGATYVPALHGEMRPARPPRAQEEGEPYGSPCLLRITTPSFRARCARRSKSLFCCAARPPQRVSRTGATPEQQARIARTRLRPVGWYPSFLLLMADGRQGGRSHLPLRAKRALICGSKCRKSFFFSLGGLLRAKKEKG